MSCETVEAKTHEVRYRSNSERFMALSINFSTSKVFVAIVETCVAVYCVCI